MKSFAALLILLFSMICGSAQEPAQVRPVTPNSSEEATELLNYLYSISGRYTLSGQHDQPIFGSAYYQLVYEVTGKYPAVKGMDFGFSEPNTLDGINYRQRTVDEAIRYHKEGSIITLMWHAVPPVKDEPVLFRGDIQSELTKQEWHDLLIPGTEINLRWQYQVDVIAFFLKQLRDAHVPVIWRPYHEMNGKWFWWGQKPGEDGYMKLYRMLFDRLVNYHKINNLLWVFNANEITGSHVHPYSDFYPGAEYVDILATDVYRGNYQQSDYESLLELANGKPIALGEVGKMPDPGLLAKQPQWTWFMTWVDFVFHANTKQELKTLYDSKRVLTRDEL